MSLSSHQSARMKSADWLTPRHILAPLGHFNLDPCCPPNMPWPTADVMLTKADDGLSATWSGRVWLNPPFWKEAAEWLRKLSTHGNGIALYAARTETKAWVELVWGKADGVLFIRGRPTFIKPDGSPGQSNSGAPIALIAYGTANAKILENTTELGQFVIWRRV